MLDFALFTPRWVIRPISPPPVFPQHLARCARQPAHNRRMRLPGFTGKNMKTTITALIAVLTLGTLHAQDGGSFRSGEFNISAFGSWMDKDGNEFAPGAGVSYFLNQNIGIGAFTHWENYRGKFFDSFSGEAYFRWPLGDMPLAPYGLAGVGYSFETEEYFGMFGGGAEWRFSDTLGVFSDIRWQINDDTDDGFGIRAGVRFVF